MRYLFFLVVMLQGCSGLALRLPEEHRQEKLKEDPPVGREEPLLPEARP